MDFIPAGEVHSGHFPTDIGEAPVYSVAAARNPGRSSVLVRSSYDVDYGIVK